MPLVGLARARRLVYDKVTPCIQCCHGYPKRTTPCTPGGLKESKGYCERMAVMFLLVVTGYQKQPVLALLVPTETL
jgi:hypothetical protein